MKLRSSAMTQGLEQAPHRSLFYAMGYTPEDLEKPIIGICNAFSEIVPGHAHLRDLVESVKLGIAAAGDGIGAYTATYNPTDASLMVPAGNAGGSYSSTLTWTLSNAPS